jgi:hypothetical protein
MINRIILLFTLWIFIKYFPSLKKYDSNTKFDVYRSLMCIYFSSCSLYNTISNFSNGMNFPFKYNNEEITDINKWFIAYIILDLIQQISTKSKRIDLYIHHFWCLGVVSMAQYFKSGSFLVNLILINEAISIVSGLDKIAMKENKMNESLKYKIYRKNIIKYLRLPIWIILLVITLKKTNNIPNILWWGCILTSLIMIKLDFYWEKKCNKVILKYK